ncbi:MAG: hypothetical protein SFU91_05035 [Chloroherpetonaceae bacterium]|nr:hypothetical protein [Chloroherpetonaceae bacterium]
MTQEDINIWEINLFNAIKDVSDLDMQRKAWLGKSLDYVSSFSEIISILYDDFDFKKYIDYYERNHKENEFCLQMKKLDEMISNYKPLISDESILFDINWIEITKQAKIIIELKNSNLIS